VKLGEENLHNVKNRQCQWSKWTFLSAGMSLKSETWTYRHKNWEIVNRVYIDVCRFELQEQKSFGMVYGHRPAHLDTGQCTKQHVRVLTTTAVHPLRLITQCSQFTYQKAPWVSVAFLAPSSAWRPAVLTEFFSVPPS
jgi:hypothetical protein